MVPETRVKTVCWNECHMTYENRVQTCNYTVCHMVPETRVKTCTYQVCHMVPETCVKQVPYTVCRPVCYQKTINCTRTGAGASSVHGHEVRAGRRLQAGSGAGMLPGSARAATPRRPVAPACCN